MFTAVHAWQHFNIASSPYSRLLLYPQNRVLYSLGDSEFDDGLGWNLDLLLRLGIKARAGLPFLLYQLAKPGRTNSPFFLIAL
jgi:hypothetical protein